MCGCEGCRKRMALTRQSCGCELGNTYADDMDENRVVFALCDFASGGGGAGFGEMVL